MCVINTEMKNMKVLFTKNPSSVGPSKLYNLIKTKIKYNDAVVHKRTLQRYINQQIKISG